MDQITNTNQIIFNDLSMKEAFRIWCKAHCIKIRKPLTNVAIWFRREIKRNCIWEYYEKRYFIRFSLKYILDLKDPFIKEISQNKNEVIPLLSLMDYRHFIISNGKRLYADNLTPDDIVYILSDNGSIDSYKIRHIDIPFTNIDMSFVFKVVESSTSHDITLESDMIILHLTFIASTNEKAVLNDLYSKLSNKHTMSINQRLKNIYEEVINNRYEFLLRNSIYGLKPENPLEKMKVGYSVYIPVFKSDELRKNIVFFGHNEDYVNKTVTFSVSVHDNISDFTDMVAKGNLNELSVIVCVFDIDLTYKFCKLFVTNKALSCVPKDKCTYEITYECIESMELRPEVGIKFANECLKILKSDKTKKY